MTSGDSAVFTIHGDADRLVPHAHAVRLKAALDAAGVRNVLRTIPGAAHGGINQEQTVAALRAVHAFLDGLGLAPALPAKP